MKVLIKSLEVNMEIKSKGIELGIRGTDDKKQIGDCYATSTGLTWCRGRTTRQNGIQITWAELQILCSSRAALKAAVATAKSV